MSRVFAISDLHVDFSGNMSKMLALSDYDYIDDVLIIAGDVSDSLERLEVLLAAMSKKFYKVLFTVGNHELWLRNSGYADSLEKFRAVLDLCDALGVQTQPYQYEGRSSSVWLVPLFSWYQLPEGGQDTLFIPKTGESWAQCGWMDTVLCRWPDDFAERLISPADYFLSLNEAVLSASYTAPIISFSHFLPRRELIFSDTAMAKRYADGQQLIPLYEGDPHPLFNFSRVAGCQTLDEQVRQLQSKVHIYGHQHRNRCRRIDNVTYVSHCLGNIKEQRALAYSEEPLCIWDDGDFIQPEDSL